LGIATQSYHEAHGELPSGSISAEYPAVPSTPWTFSRWSALAMLTPYMETQVAQDALDMSVPLYNTGLVVTSENREGVRAMISTFLCPSDVGQRVLPDFGPTNYAVCTGSGVGGGTPIHTDGPFAVNSRVRLDDVRDGTTHTILISEGILGRPEASGGDPALDYKFHFVAPLTETACDAASIWNYGYPRGFAWVSGEYRCAMYNHHRPPNSPTPDCVSVQMGGDVTTRFTPYGWRTARSYHPDGVNVALGDGSVRFIPDSVDLDVWQALATIRGGEATGEY
jgi:prepilin-type processing-associated H-X9-DG protein